MNARVSVRLIVALTLYTAISACSSKVTSSDRPKRDMDAIAQRGGHDGSVGDSLAQADMSSPSSSISEEVSPQKPSEQEAWGWIQAGDAPFSTASIDVDTASYTRYRAQIHAKRNPDKSQIRVEDFINYFAYDYAAPSDDKIIKIHQELTPSPYTKGSYILRLGLKGKELEVAPSAKNLVFLVDVSGSMGDEDKLPLVKASLKQLLNSLTEKDSIAIVSYAGSSGLVLPATKGSDKAVIKAAIDKLGAGGGTNGADGMKLAYEIASKQFISGGVNRVVMATDGDFNVGATSHEELLNIIKKSSDLGVFLTILGYGISSNDALMENVAKDGDGNYFFIDSINEMDKVVNVDFKANIVTLAKDVKIQLEFNPRLVKSYRMVGYVNRKLADEDFNNDKKDAGDLGSGQSVTYLYELSLRDQAEAFVSSYKLPEGTDPLLYQAEGKLSEQAAKEELGTIKLRYKSPEGLQSEKFDEAIPYQVAKEASGDLSWQIAVAASALNLLDIKGIEMNKAAILEGLEKGLGKDERGLRKEYLELIRGNLK